MVSPLTSGAGLDNAGCRGEVEAGTLKLKDDALSVDPTGDSAGYAPSDSVIVDSRSALSISHY
jgi:hypothetical protein